MLFVGLIVVMTFVVAWVYGFLDAATSDAAAVRRLPKGGWMALTFLLPTLGSLAWFAVGRPVARPGAAPARPTPAPTGPDDDPEFQRRLRERVAEQRRRAEEQKRAQGE